MALEVTNDVTPFTANNAHKFVYGEGDSAMGIAVYRLLYNGATWDVGGFGSGNSMGDITTNWNATDKTLELDWTALETTFAGTPALFATAELAPGSPSTARFIPQGKGLTVNTGVIAFFNDVTGALENTEHTKMACYFAIVGYLGALT